MGFPLGIDSLEGSKTILVKVKVDQRTPSRYLAIRCARISMSRFTVSMSRYQLVL